MCCERYDAKTDLASRVSLDGRLPLMSGMPKPSGVTAAMMLPKMPWLEDYRHAND
jgi:hypothetical protein